MTYKGGPVDRAHIVPFSINDSPNSLRHLPVVFHIAERLLGPSFKESVKKLVNGLGRSDRPWNVLTLTPYVHRMWDTNGIVGFQPRYIDSVDGGHYATFTFHWLLKNGLEPSDIAPELTPANCQDMVSESESFAAKRHNIFEMVYTPQRQAPNDVRRLEDGKVCRIKFATRGDAENMMRMLQLRWAAGRLWCLAGAATDRFVEPGQEDVDSDSDDSDDGHRVDWGWQDAEDDMA